MITEDQNHKYFTISEVFDELNKIKAIGLPITAINIMHYLKGMSSVACMGRLGRTELAGGALAIGFTNVTGYSILAGLAMGIEPICSQAFGSGNVRLATHTLRRCVMLLLFVSIPIAMLWLNLRAVMMALHQDAMVADIAAQYCSFAVPDLVANSFLQSIRVYFRSKGAPCPLMWCMSLAVVLHIPLTYYLSTNFGVGGVAIATCTTNFNTLLFLSSYMMFDHFKSKSVEPAAEHTYVELPKSAISSKNAVEWARLLRLAIPSCLGVCLEWWWYELMTLISGYLSNPNVSLATAAIVIQTTALLYTLPTTLSTSVSARVGNELGAGRPRNARTAATIAIGLAIMGSLVSLLWTTLGREAWGKVFTEDVEVLELTKRILPVIGLCELANCPQTTGCGVLRGSARPSIGAAINLYSFYFIGAPVAILLAFGLDMGFMGLCLGLLSAQVVCAVSVIFVAYRTQWVAEAQKAVNLVGNGPQKIQITMAQAQEEEEGLLAVVVCET